MKTTASTSESASQSFRISIVHAAAAVASLSVAALVLSPPAQPHAAGERPSLVKSDERKRKPAHEPAPSPADAETEVGPSRAAQPALAGDEPAKELVQPAAPGDSEFLLSVAERRDLEEERRAEAVNRASVEAAPSPELIETPEEEQEMNALAQQRKLEREHRSAAGEAGEAP